MAVISYWDKKQQKYIQLPNDITIGIDSELDENSENPVQNKAIVAEIETLKKSIDEKSRGGTGIKRVMVSATEINTSRFANGGLDFSAVVFNIPIADIPEEDIITPLGISTDDGSYFEFTGLAYGVMIPDFSVFDWGKENGDYSSIAITDYREGGVIIGSLQFEYYWSPASKYKRDYSQVYIEIVSRVTIQNLKNLDATYTLSGVPPANEWHLTLLVKDH